MWQSWNAGNQRSLRYMDFSDANKQLKSPYAYKNISLKIRVQSGWRDRQIYANVNKVLNQVDKQKNYHFFSASIKPHNSRKRLFV